MKVIKVVITEKVVMILIEKLAMGMKMKKENMNEFLMINPLN